jgi:drug/metabolite transporter (DMT)-like permease
MPVSAAYLIVIIIWSTAPLGIVWSSESVNPTMAVLLRMVIAATLGWSVLLIKKIHLPYHRQALRLYSYSSIGIVGGMLLAYLAAQSLPSGIISLVFGLAPIISGLLAQKILKEPKFSIIRQIAMLLSLFGLGLVCSDSISFGKDSLSGLAYVLSAVFFFSLSGVMNKSVDINIHPLATTVGSLIFSVPLFVIAWLIFDGTAPIETWQARSIWAIIYLGVIGSLVGFVAYFYVLQKLNASTVALITMITPVIALSLGAYLNDEVISLNLVYGAIFVMSGLGLYQWGDRLFNIKTKDISKKT